MVTQDKSVGLIEAEHEIVDVVYAYIDRMNDACESDPMYKIAEEFVKEVNPSIDKHLNEIRAMSHLKQDEISNIEENEHLSYAICEWWKSWKHDGIADWILVIYLSGAWSASDGEIADDIHLLKSIVESSEKIRWMKEI